jgi:hypothetical protein
VPCLSEPRHGCLPRRSSRTAREPRPSPTSRGCGCRARSEENDGDRSSAAWLGFASYVWRGRFWVLPVLCAGLTQASRGWAYRPFDGTDAAVADVGEVEIELQPAGLLHQSSQSTLIAPFVVYNYGFAERWEFVVQGQTETPLCRHRVPAA